MGEQKRRDPPTVGAGGPKEGYVSDDKCSRYDTLPQVWPWKGTPTAYLVLGCLAHHAYKRSEECWPSSARLAELTGLSPRSVFRALRDLEEAGHIERNPTPGKSTRYRLQSTRATGDTPPVPLVAHEEEEEKKKKWKKTLSPPPPSRETAGSGRELKKDRRREDDFNAFWTAYPKKKAKGGAREAWAKSAREGKLPALSVLLEAVEAQKRSRQWQDEGGRFIPHPATWLRGERWADELEPATRSGWHPDPAADFPEDPGDVFTSGVGPASEVAN